MIVEKFSEFRVENNIKFLMVTIKQIVGNTESRAKFPDGNLSV